MLKSSRPELVALGKIIRRHREHLGISQEDFAHDQGFGRSYYWHVEHGQINLSVLKLIKIAKGLKTTAPVLLREAEESYLKRKR